MAHPTTHPAAKATPPPVLRLALLSPEEMPAEWRDPARWWQTAYTLMSVLDHDATRMAIEADNEDSPLATLFFSTALGDFAQTILRRINDLLEKTHGDVDGGGRVVAFGGRERGLLAADQDRQR